MAKEPTKEEHWMTTPAASAPASGQRSSISASAFFESWPSRWRGGVELRTITSAITLV